jgi:hypothetical protein
VNWVEFPRIGLKPGAQARSGGHKGNRGGSNEFRADRDLYSGVDGAVRAMRADKVLDLAVYGFGYEGRAHQLENK